MYEVVFYKDARGNSPVENLIKELDSKAKTSKMDRIALKQIRLHIDMLEKLGTRAGEVKYIEGDIWELRPSKNRVMMFAWQGNTFVLLSWFRKKTNKTPKREIDKAYKHMNDWINNHGE